MKDLILQTTYWAVFANCAGFVFGSALSKKFRTPIFNPILVSTLLVIAFLCIADIPYADYEKSVAPLSYLLAPATVALALPLYEQLETVAKNCAAILVSLTAGLLAGMSGVLAIAVIFGLDHAQYITLLPKSITTPIGLCVSDELGGIRSITVAAIILTGIFGNISADWICRKFKITNPISKGLAIGNCAHVIGTTKAFEMGEVEGAMGGVAVLLAGIITVFAATVFATLY